MTRLAVVLVLLGIAAIVNYGISAPEAALNRRSLLEFPKTIGEWEVVDEQYMDEASKNMLQVDDYFMRTYENKRGETIGVYIGYFTSQREGKGIHSPRQCLPGAGWNIIGNSEYMLPLQNHNPANAPVNLFTMGKGNERELYMWWYHGRGRIYADEYMNKVYLITDSITKRRTDGALVRLNMRIQNSSEETLQTIVGFIKPLLADLQEYIPD